MAENQEVQRSKLLLAILDGIIEKKGKDIVNIDFSKVENAICQNFIICHGDSNTQVDAIADNVVKQVSEKLETKVLHKEGFENCQWVLLDYADIIVHVFQKEYRDYYKLEELWADAKIETIDSE